HQGDHPHRPAASAPPCRAAGRPALPAICRRHREADGYARGAHMTLSVIPGPRRKRVYARLRRAMARSPESITTIVAMTLGRLTRRTLVIMDSGLGPS